jgi:opacity protein-like surface antigen
MNRIIASIFLAGAAALGCAHAAAQPDIAASVYGTFSGTTTGNNVIQSPSNAAGVLFEVREIKNPLVGFEGSYGYNRADQGYRLQALPADCPTPTSGGCGITNALIPNNAHEITGDWIVSFKVANLRPFALAGGGLLLNEPRSAPANTTSAASTMSATKGVLVYGGGLDWGFLPHVGLRFQYRGNVYSAPALTSVFTSSGAFVHTAEPVVGIYFKL